MSEWSAFTLDAGRAGQNWLTPGRVLRALHTGAGIPTGSVGALKPLDRGRIQVHLPAGLAATIATPLPLGLDGQVVTLRRDDDLRIPGETRADGQIAGEVPSPGAASVAFAEALGDGYGAEDLGLTLIAGQQMVAELPPLSGGRLPETLAMGPATVTLDDGGKKNS